MRMINYLMNRVTQETLPMISFPSSSLSTFRKRDLWLCLECNNIFYDMLGRRINNVCELWIKFHVM